MIYSTNVSSCIDIRFYVVVKEFDEIFHLGCSESSYFINILKCFNLLEDKSGRGENLSRDNNFLLECENPAMKIFKLLSVLEVQGG